MTTQTAAAQQCFRSRPLLQEKGSVVSVFSHMARQECAHDISLNERVGVSPTMPPLLQRLLTIRIRLRIVLRHLQLIGIEFDHLAAGTFSLTFEMLYKLTHSPPVCRPSEAALKRPVIVFLNSIVLGRIEPEPQTEEVEGVLEVKTSEPVTVEVPELPKGYEWDGTCMVRYVPNKDGVLEAHPFCKVRFYLIDRIRNAEGKFEFVARAHFPKGIIREFNIPGNIVGGGGSKLLEVLGAYEIMTLNTKDATAQMAAYIKDAVNKLTEQKAVTSTHTSFGWQPDGSFLMGNRLYKPTGEVTEVLLSGYAYDNYAAFPPPRVRWKPTPKSSTGSTTARAWSPCST